MPIRPIGRVASSNDVTQRLRPDLVEIDYWTFLVAATDLTHSDPHRCSYACETVIDTYRGQLGGDLASEWILTQKPSG